MEVEPSPPTMNPPVPPLSPSQLVEEPASELGPNPPAAVCIEGCGFDQWQAIHLNWAQVTGGPLESVIRAASQMASQEAPAQV